MKFCTQHRIISSPDLSYPTYRWIHNANGNISWRLSGSISSTVYLILKFFDLNFAFLFTSLNCFILIVQFWRVIGSKNEMISLVWMQPWKISVWMMSQKKFVVCDGSDNFLRWLFLDLRWSCMTVGPLTIWSNYRPKMTDYPSFLHSSSTRLEFTPQKI